ncbi:trypsin-like serine protease [Sinorhizobium meliloti]|nr:trypsin-like serine protease [Sinorhizobium meliloti]MDW9654093.1 trypsin-like serine protease [Sinorhizobium meliloti]MDW9914507.1 trypsin-like serine protease [Sinorhizobium meliloti]MDW9937973.1 trypsin-like serine protease [Sinorhizobium meliloti]MDW9945702.1 trypsin-like serine protease [Sinorhizobium meliloti]
MERERKLKRARHPGGTNGLWAAVVVLFWLATADPTLAKSPAEIFSLFQSRVAHIEIKGETFDGETDVEAASGFLLNKRFVITNSHVLPDQDDYKTLEILVRLGSRKNTPIRAKATHRDEQRDLALLEIEDSSLPQVGGCPLKLISDGSETPIGTRIYIMGFPIDDDITLQDGLISNKATSLRWRTNALINVGNSGSAAISEDAVLVGFAVGGVVTWTHNGVEHHVTGVNTLIPGMLFWESELSAKLSAVPGQDACVVKDLPVERLPGGGDLLGGMLGGGIVLRDVFTEFSMGVDDDAPAARVSPISRTFSFEGSVERGGIPQEPSFERRFTAENGFILENCTWSAFNSADVGEVTCMVDPGGQSALFRFSAAENAIDAARAWWHGTVTLQQRPILDVR